jgi:hypothetical protein
MISIITALFILIYGIYKSFNTAQTARPGWKRGLIRTFRHPNILQRKGGVTLITRHLNNYKEELEEFDEFNEV